MRTHFTLAVVVLILAGARLHAQQAVAEEPVGLAQAIEQLGKKAGALDADMGTLVSRILAGKIAAKDAAESVIALHRDFLAAEVNWQRLLTLQLVLGKNAAGKKTAQEWLNHADKIAPRLPQAPAPRQLPDFAAAEKHVLATPPAVEVSAKKLGAYLGKAGKTEWEKAYAIYVWMGNNLAYDVDAYLAGKFEGKVETTLDTRRCVCDGFARLYESLSLNAGLRAPYVPGQIRTLTPVTFKHPDLLRTSLGLTYVPHAWNALTVGDSVYFIDPTNANGQRHRKGITTRDRPTQFDYFLMPPEVALTSLVPKEERWRRLKTPYRQKDHETWPLVWPRFHSMNVRLQSHPYPVAVTEGQLLISIEAPTEAALFGLIQPIGLRDPQPAQPALVQRSGNQVFFRAGFSKPGSYEFNVAEKKSNEPGSSVGVVSYRVEVRAESPAPPKVYKRFLESGSYLYFPLREKVKANQPQSFVVAAPGATAAILQAGDKRIPLEQRGDLFMGEVMLEPGNVRMFARFGAEEQVYQALLEFTVE